MKLKNFTALCAMSVALVAANDANAVGCVGGAIAGGIIGKAVKHPFLGAASGCFIAHEANVRAKKEKLAQQQAQQAQMQGGADTAPALAPAGGTKRPNPF
jgi:hypothetical protein